MKSSIIDAVNALKKASSSINKASKINAPVSYKPDIICVPDYHVNDLDFYNAMKLDIAEAAFYKKPFYHCWALTYCISVSMFGKNHFYFADSPKGLKDL